MPTWDDSSYLINNSLIRELTPSSLWHIFSTDIGGAYVPLPILTYAIEYQIWGLTPLPYHATNLLLHLVCTVLAYLIFVSLGLRKQFAFAGALIFGVHPMGVESVAWVTERKDLLYCLFYFASTLLYIYYVKNKEKNTLFYFASLGLFVLALLSKIQAVSLPIILLLVDYYFERKGWRKIVSEKTPFLLLSLITGIIGIVVLENIGALRINELYSFTERFFFGMYALSAYFLKFLVPVTLSAVHPYPVHSGFTLPVLYYLSPLFVLITGFLVYLTATRTRAVAFGMLFFFGAIVFMLQIFGAGQGFLADRFTKVPYLGLIFIAAWGMEQLYQKWRSSRPLIWAGCVTICLVLMGVTYVRCGVWKNGETLWTDVIKKYPMKDSRPYACRGLHYRTENQNEKALADFNATLVLDNNNTEIRLMRGNIYFDKGKDDSAYSDYIQVLKVTMDNPLALGNLGAILIRRNKPDSAVYYLTRAISLDSAVAITFANRAVAYGRMGRAEESIADFKRFLRIEPDNERVCMSIAVAYQNSDRFQESLEWFDKAISMKPDFGNYYYFRSRSHIRLGNREKALADGVRARDLGAPVPEEYINSLR